MNDPLATRQNHLRGPHPGDPRPGGPRTVRRRPVPQARPPEGPAAPAPDSPLATQQDVRREYVLPATPTMAWTILPEKRSRRLGRLALLVILVLQAALTLRLDNTAFQDEALYLYAGRLLLEGGSSTDYATYFSGAPYLYPLLAAPFDQAWGLEGARVLSLLLMLGVTALIYSFTRRLFDPRSALLGAASYAVIAPTAFLGSLATYDALAVLLLTFAVWLAVLLAHRTLLSLLLIAPICLLAFAVKYATGIFLPLVIAVMIVVAMPRKGAFRAVLQGMGLAALAALLISAFFLLGGVDEGIRFTTTGRAEGGDDALTVLRMSAERSGLYLLVALFGAVVFWRKGPLNEIPGMVLQGPSPRVRALLGLVLVGSALVIPLYQAQLHTLVALTKHLGYGMMFAAPLVGMGMSRLLGAHFRSPQFPIAAWLALFALGYTQAQTSFTAWPHSGDLTRLLRTEVARPSAEVRYLASVPQVPIYSLGTDRTSPGQWTQTYGFTDFASVRAGKFDLIVLDSGITPDVNARVRKEIVKGGHYRLRARFVYDQGELKGSHRIWVKVS